MVKWECKDSDVMRKGFTLIELLAVIVILAIIALIAIPQVLNLIRDSKEKSLLISEKNYIRAVEEALYTKNIDEEFNPSICTIERDGNLLCIQNSKIENLKVEVNGTRPCGGAIVLNSLEVTDETISFTCDSPSFAKDDWLTIIANIRLGKDVYKVGEEKEIVLIGEEFNNQSYTVRIANISNNEAEGCEGENFSETACGFVIEFVDIITKHVINSANSTSTMGTNKGGWPKSELYEYLNIVTKEDGTDKEGTGVIYNSISEEIRKNIIDTKVISSHGKGDTSNLISIDKLYLLSTKEIYGTADDEDTVTETRQLDYYKKQGVTADLGKYASAIKKYNGNGTSWWLRSARLSNSVDFLNVLSNGGPHVQAHSSDNLGVAPAFRIG